MSAPFAPSLWTVPIHRCDLVQIGRHRLLCGDSTRREEVEHLLQGEQIGACVTDPPYGKKYTALYGSIASLLADILPRGGSFLSIVPQYLLPRVLSDVAPFLKYRWTHCMWQGSGDHPRMTMGIEVMWKPVVWWVKDAWPYYGFVRDGFENVQPKKSAHPWQQSLSWAEFCLHLLPMVDVIFEPFLGAGTLIIAAERMGKTVYAMEIDPVTCARAVFHIQEQTGLEARVY